MADWTVVIPVKGTAAAKSRLGAPPELARALALDTVAAAAGATRVLVVTAGNPEPFEALGAQVVRDRGAGLLPAIHQALGATPEGPTAVLLGDLPALQASELGGALELAEHHPLGFVPDADGSGTVLITALAAGSHRPAFGPGSREAHLAVGYVELAVSPDSGIRRDVDTPDQLALLAARVGPHTRAVLDHRDGFARTGDGRARI